MLHYMYTHTIRACKVKGINVNLKQICMYVSYIYICMHVWGGRKRGEGEGEGEGEERVCVCVLLHKFG